MAAQRRCLTAASTLVLFAAVVALVRHVSVSQRHDTGGATLSLEEISARLGDSRFGGGLSIEHQDRRLEREIQRLSPPTHRGAKRPEAVQYFLGARRRASPDLLSLMLRSELSSAAAQVKQAGARVIEYRPPPPAARRRLVLNKHGATWDVVVGAPPLPANRAQAPVQQLAEKDTYSTYHILHYLSRAGKEALAENAAAAAATGADTMVAEQARSSLTAEAPLVHQLAAVAPHSGALNQERRLFNIFTDEREAKIKARESSKRRAKEALAHKAAAAAAGADAIAAEQKMKAEATAAAEEAKINALANEDGSGHVGGGTVSRVASNSKVASAANVQAQPVAVTHGIASSTPRAHAAHQPSHDDTHHLLAYGAAASKQASSLALVTAATRVQQLHLSASVQCAVVAAHLKLLEQYRALCYTSATLKCGAKAIKLLRRVSECGYGSGDSHRDSDHSGKTADMKASATSTASAIKTSAASTSAASTSATSTSATSTSATSTSTASAIKASAASTASAATTVTSVPPTSSQTADHVQQSVTVTVASEAVSQGQLAPAAQRSGEQAGSLVTKRKLRTRSAAPEEENALKPKAPAEARNQHDMEANLAKAKTQQLWLSSLSGEDQGLGTDNGLEAAAGGVEGAADAEKEYVSAVKQWAEAGAGKAPEEFVNAVKDWADKMPLLPPLPPEAADAEEEMVPEEEEMAPEEEKSAPGLGAGFAAGVLCAKTVS